MTITETRKTLLSLTSQRAKLDRKIAECNEDIERFERIKLAGKGIRLSAACLLRIGASVQSADRQSFSRLLSVGNIRFGTQGERTLYLANGDERRVLGNELIQVQGDR